MRPFRVNVPQADLDDLRNRLAAMRWPACTPDVSWSRGVPQSYLRDLVDHWRTFDWRATEARINRFPQFVASIDGADIHLLHVRSPEPDAVPLLITHGWPGSFLEFLDVIGPLTDPAAHGGDPRDAFHVVIPSLPGFGFSSPIRQHGWSVPRVATAWSRLMAELGYDRYVAQGGDLGAFVTIVLGLVDSDHVLGSHVNFLFTPPSGDPADLADLDADDLARLDQLARSAEGTGYMMIQATRPQTIGYALTDSPAGQLAWLVEKFYEWTGSVASPEEVIDRDALLANATLYWLTRTATSAAHFYCDNADLLPISSTPPQPMPPLPVPVGVAVYPDDVARPVRRLAERRLPDIVHWNELDSGGHFAALEQPDLFVADLRTFGRVVRGARVPA